MSAMMPEPPDNDDPAGACLILLFIFGVLLWALFPGCW